MVEAGRTQSGQLPMIDPVIQYRVDHLLLEQGEYLPLEFLLQEGRLNYTDYEAWRNGELNTLDTALFGDHEHIQQQLLQAADYLQRLGWQAEAVSYQIWQGDHSPLLSFSQNSVLNHCFHQRYHKPQDQLQMDMFTDAPATSRVNGITQALVNRNAEAARRQLEGLYDSAPDHVRLGELERLVEAAENLDTAVIDAAADLRILQESLTPLAESLLGKDSRNLLIPLWRRLSSALHGQPYQTAQPELHASYTASRTMDWDIARLALEQVPDWQAESVLLQRHARACEQLHRRGNALLSWFNLCWRFPQHSDAIESSSDAELRQQWLAFLELEPELPTPTFPAWMLVIKPGLTKVLACTPASASPCTPGQKVRNGTFREAPLEDLLGASASPCTPGHLLGASASPCTPGHLLGASASPCTASYQTMYQLQNNLSDPTDEHIALRAQLKQQDPVLFQHYLKTLK